MTAREGTAVESVSYLLVVVAVSGAAMAVPADALAELVHEPELVRPPRLPAAVAGFFRLRGRVVPVLRPEVLFDLPPPLPGPFRVLLVFRGIQGGSRHGGRWALLVERALSVVEAPDHLLEPVPAGHSLGECVSALFAGPDGPVPVLAPERLLRRREEMAMAELSQWAEQRWEEFSIGHP